ncbi:MAG: delta-60 repeat domain-containing protein [Sulfuricurvum sp.]|uniref:delta-60 repeat domain-containing protein n=1 Tax=Sulfuricurvum sp. TaxID=2025608 RepID=UPI0026167235|nr:delta-60 repeat domain-containing protein [Sulfuricurvum sp.]MDD2829228.1 delta-60 repeat domain-containing protein [Sulfuricurvum sp.]MDD4949061.1 delta-60 repeat domain-containing protein [Sulfuricurvum sp.]
MKKNTLQDQMTVNEIINIQKSEKWNNSEIYSIIVQNDGKKLFAKFIWNGLFKDFVLIRYNTDETLDTAFGSEGKVITPFGSNEDESYRVTIQNDGKIIVASYLWNSSFKDFSLVRYNSDGSIDKSFETLPSPMSKVVYTNDGMVMVSNSDITITDMDLISIGYHV